MPTLKATFLDCTLARSPRASSTRSLIDTVIALMGPMGVQCEVVRVVDHQVAFGITSDEGRGDQWPSILRKMRASDIIVLATPTRAGARSSVAQLVIERLEGTCRERDPSGQYPLYGKVAGVLVSGDEGDAHDAAASTLFDLSHLGCVVPPNSDCCWIRAAGTGRDVGGEVALQTHRTARYLAHNTVWFARLLREHRIPTDLRRLDAEARVASRR
jgi:multimeric flavodoxin WrbA